MMMMIETLLIHSVFNSFIVSLKISSSIKKRKFNFGNYILQQSSLNIEVILLLRFPFS